MNFSVMLGGLISAAPYLVAWIAGIVVAVIMIRHGGGRAERFLLAGFSLMFVSSVLAVPTAALVPWLVERGASRVSIASAISGFNILRGCISLAGIVCLVYAFWVKFKVKS